jgi:hypothetical protein
MAISKATLEVDEFVTRATTQSKTELTKFNLKLQELVDVQLKKEDALKTKEEQLKQHHNELLLLNSALHTNNQLKLKLIEIKASKKEDI